MGETVNLVKLCVGVESPADLEAWQVMRADQNRAAGLDDRPRHVTRMWPRRDTELLNGGSLYWVFKGVILARQSILDLQKHTGADGIERCAIILGPTLQRTAPAPRRPFQGWRYLRPEDAPPDLGTDAESDLPPEMVAELSALGVI